MLKQSFKPAKCKTALKLAMSRIKLMKNKKENHLKQLKKELAQLLQSGQDQTARIRVEHVVREEKMIAAYDLIDIYCELIVGRLPIIEFQKNCPIDLKEAVTSVVFAAPRCGDIPELQDVRKHFVAKYGKEFVGAAIELRPECGVSHMLVGKLSADAPDGQTKLKILTAIAEEHKVEWDPKTFGEKESKPYDDLLKGPNTFDMASKMQSEPPIIQAPPPPPNVHAPQSRDQRHGAPVNYQQNLHSSSSQNFASSNISANQAASSAAPHPPLRHSGTDYERTETRHSHLRPENDFSLDWQNWNMEFKDATAAAQAAAESAEQASMAARAAAELSSREKIMRQHSNKSCKSNADGMRNDKPRKNNDLPSEKFVKVGNYNSPKERNPKPSMWTADADGYVDESHYNADDRSYNGDHTRAKRFDQSASSRSGTGSISADSKNNFHEVDRYSQKSSLEEKEVKPENSASLSGTRVNKQSSGKDPSDGDNYVNSASHQNFVFDDDENPFGHGKSWKEIAESGDIGSVEAVCDSYVSDDIIKFDKLPQYDKQDLNSYSASIIREPSNHFDVNIEKGSSRENSSRSSKKHLSAFRVSTEIFSPSQFHHSSPKAASLARSEDLVPATFDDSRGPNSDGKDDRKYVEVAGQNKHGKELSSQSRTKFFYDEMSSSRSSSTRRNSKVSSIEITHELSPQSSRFSSVNEMTSVPTTTAKNEVFDQSRFESGEELMFSTLNGGRWKKEYKGPPYRKSPSGDSLLSKGSTKDSPTYIRTVHDSPRVESSSSTSGMGQKVEENSSSRTRFKRYDLGTDEFEEEVPQQNLRSKQEQTKEKSSLRSRIKNYDLGTDDAEKELPKPKLANKQGRKEDYTKSKFSPPVGYLDPDDDDSEEDLPERPSTVNVCAEGRYFRRPKANPDSEASFHPKTRHGSPASVNSYSVSENKPDISENRPKQRPQSGKHPTRPVPEEKQKLQAMEQSSRPLKPTTSSGTETSRASSGEAPSRESSLKKASHVHPKLPDYDSIAAYFLSLRKNHG